MKFNQIKYILLFAVTIGLSSCKKNFIDLTPESTLTEANFYRTENDIDKSVLGVYAVYKGRIQTDWIIFGMPSDEMYPTGYHNYFGLNDISNLNFSPDNPHYNDFWGDCYKGISRANAVLQNVDKPDNYKTPESKLQYIGEAKFMRALFYFDLVKAFGGVPKIDGPITVEQAKNLARSSEQEIYSLITADLKDAVTKLPMAMPRGRASKGAAVALLTKIYVYQKKWDTAKSYLDQIMSADYDYDLVPDYKMLWTEVTEDNKESIFAMPYIADIDGQTLSSTFLPYFGVTGLSSHGQENAFPTWSFMKLFQSGDTRYPVSVTEYWKSPGSPADQPAIWYPYINKFAVPEKTPSSSGMDIPVIRFGDIILLGAEIEYNLNHKTEALSLLNRIRERAFHDESHDYSLNDISDKASFYDKLLLERELELGFENDRWPDLVRTGRLVQALSAIETAYNPVDGKSVTRHLDPKPYMKYFPIPQPQIDITNKGVLKQNEGY